MLPSSRRLKIDRKRAGLFNFKNGAPFEGGNRCPLGFKRHVQDRSRRSSVDLMPSFPVPSNLYGPRVSKDSGIERNCLFGLIIEPQTRSDLLNDLHAVSPVRV